MGMNGDVFLSVAYHRSRVTAVVARAEVGGSFQR